MAGVARGGQRTDTVATTDSPAGHAVAGPMPNLSEGIELPDWLKRAAAEQPFDPNRQTAINASPYGPAGTHAGAPAMDGVNDMGGEAGQAPLGGRSGDDAVVTQSNTAPAADVSDTSTFISEDDLPDWIRQLAAADEAKKTEEVQRAAAAAAADGKTATSADPRRRRSLPGETTVSGPATNPWLARREQADGSEIVAADSWGTPAATEVGRLSPEVAPAPVTIPASTPEAMVADHRPMPPVSPAAKQPNQMRLVLMAAVVLIVVALVAFMALS